VNIRSDRIWLFLAVYMLGALNLQVRASDVELLISVREFSSSDPRIGSLVTDLMKTGLAGSPILRVLESRDSQSSQEMPAPPAIDTDYQLEGSAMHHADGISVAYRLLDSASGRILQAGTIRLMSGTVEQDAAGLAVSLGNTLLAVYAGSTVASIEELLGAQRWDEAGRRLESFEARNPDHPAVKDFREQISRGKAGYWYERGNVELSAARKAKGQEALVLARQARISYESALLLIPDGPADLQLRDSISRILAGPVSEAADRGFAQTRQALNTEAKALLRQDSPLEALLLIEDFVSLYGENALGEKLLATRTSAVLARGRELAVLARLALSRGELLSAESYIREAVALTPLEHRVQSVASEVGLAVARDDAGIAIAELTRFDPGTEYRISWFLSAGFAMTAYEAADFSLPLQGTIPGVELGGGWLLSSRDGLRAALRGTLSLAGNEGDIQVWGYDGSMNALLVLAEFGAELGVMIALPGGRNLVPGLAVDIGALHARWNAGYPGAPDADGSGWTLAPAARIGLQLGLGLSPELESRIGFSSQAAWVPGFGPIGGLRLTVSARRFFR
jgi:hypothetical protein